MIVSGSGSLVLAEPKHLPYIVKWKNDHNDFWKPTSIKEEARRIELDSQTAYTLVSTRHGKPIGMVEMNELNSIARSKRAKILCGGDEDEILTVSMLKMLEFENLATNKIQVEILASDSKKVRVYERQGFKAEVRKRQHRLIDGKFQTVVQLAILAANYERNQDESAPD